MAARNALQSILYVFHYRDTIVLLAMSHQQAKLQVITHKQKHAYAHVCIFTCIKRTEAQLLALHLIEISNPAKFFSSDTVGRLGVLLEF